MKENWIISEVTIDSEYEYIYEPVQIKVFCEEDDISDKVSDILGFAIHSCTYEMEDDEYERIDVPTWALPYLINGDLDNLSDDEMEWCKRFEREYCVLDWDSESHIGRYGYRGILCNMTTCKCKVL